MTSKSGPSLIPQTAALRENAVHISKMVQDTSKVTINDL